MRFLSALAFCCLCLFSASSITAEETRNNQQNIETKCFRDFIEMPFFPQLDCCESQQVQHFGTAAFSVTDPAFWYTLQTNSYPFTTPLSLSRNKGSAQGRVYLSPTGVTIGESGNYWVSITAILQNPNEETVLYPVFLVKDEQFNPSDESNIGGITALNPGFISTVNASGILQNVSEGTRLSLVVTNAGYPIPQNVNVVSWSICLFKLP